MLDSFLEIEPGITAPRIGNCPSCDAENVFLRHTVVSRDSRRHVECCICSMRGPVRVSNKEAVDKWNELGQKQVFVNGENISPGTLREPDTLELAREHSARSGRFICLHHHTVRTLELLIKASDIVIVQEAVMQLGPSGTPLNYTIVTLVSGRTVEVSETAEQVAAMFEAATP